MFRRRTGREPAKSIETGEMPAVDRGERDPSNRDPQKGWRSSRSLTIFKSLVLSALVVVTLYGMLNRGLFGPDRLLPVVAAVLGMLFITLFIDYYYADVSRPVWVLVGLLAALVAVKGLSLTWSISRIETVQELLRSSMYLGAFVLAAASLSSRRLVRPFVDALSLVAGSVAGYGMLQKTNPNQYPTNTPDGVRVGSTLEYANTVAVVLGMGIALALGRMTGLRNPVARGLYAVLILVLGTVLYFTFSRGGLLSLAVGLVALFAVGERRPQMLANLLLVAGPLVWLIERARGLETLFGYSSDEGLRAADGAAFRTDLVIAVLAAFVLQAGFSFLMGRRELAPRVRLALGAAVVAVVVAGAGVAAYSAADRQAGAGGPVDDFAKGAEKNQDVSERLTSASSNDRSKYWRVAWEAWKERPLTGTGAGTFMYTWLEERPGFSGVRQVHNVYLEQGTETGVVAFVALCGFAVFLIFYTLWAAWRAPGERRVLLSGLSAATVVYLVSSALEWHWYIPPSTLFFFILAGAAAKFASKPEWEAGPRGIGGEAGEPRETEGRTS